MIAHRVKYITYIYIYDKYLIKQKVLNTLGKNIYNLFYMKTQTVIKNN